MIKRTSKTTTLPVTLADLKAHCWVDGTADDDLIQTYADAASEYIEHYTGRDFTSATYEHCFTTCAGIKTFVPCTIDSVKYYDTDNTLQTMSTDDYLVYIDDYCTTITIEEPVDLYDRPDALIVTCSPIVAGLNRYEQALKMIVKHWYENRDAEVVGVTTTEMKIGTARLLNSLVAGGGYH